MARFLSGDIRLHKLGMIFAGSYIGAMAFGWITANATLTKILLTISMPGLWLADYFVTYLRAEHGVTWLAAFPPDLSFIVSSPLGEKAMSILLIGVLLTIVLLYALGYFIGKKIR